MSLVLVRKGVYDFVVVFVVVLCFFFQDVYGVHAIKTKTNAQLRTLACLRRPTHGPTAGSALKLNVLS